ncbi:MAG: pyridoxal 5'-phosphate synthase glutaminase subunit PdxT [Candidatus Acidiferrum sp.]
MAGEPADAEREESRALKIGILAVQGDFAAHGAMLDALGVESVAVRAPKDLDGCDGLILPGGESTTQLQFLQEEGLFAAIKSFAGSGKAVFGTCAGAILLATEVQNPRQDSLQLLDVTILRNAYGRQMASDVFTGTSKPNGEPLEMVFIRAPIIQRLGDGVEVLAEYAGRPTWVQRGTILATTFHPELTTDSTVHRHFLQLVRNGENTGKGAARAQRIGAPFAARKN